MARTYTEQTATRIPNSILLECLKMIRLIFPRIEDDRDSKSSAKFVNRARNDVSSFAKSLHINDRKTVNDIRLLVRHQLIPNENTDYKLLLPTHYVNALTQIAIHTSLMEEENYDSHIKEQKELICAEMRKLQLRILFSEHILANTYAGHRDKSKHLSGRYLCFRPSSTRDRFGVSKLHISAPKLFSGEVLSWTYQHDQITSIGSMNKTSGSVVPLEGLFYFPGIVTDAHDKPFGMDLISLFATDAKLPGGQEYKCGLILKSAEHRQPIACRILCLRISNDIYDSDIPLGSFSTNETERIWNAFTKYDYRGQVIHADFDILVKQIAQDESSRIFQGRG